LLKSFSNKQKDYTMSLQLFEYSSKKLAEFESKLQEFVIPDPNEELIQIYETDKLINLLHIRAEKYDSPEFSTELAELKAQSQNKKDFKVPRHIQNPNFDQVLSFLKSLRQAKNTPDQVLEIIHKLLQFSHAFTEIPDDFQPKIMNHLIDVRIITTIEEYFHYLLTRYLITETLRSILITLIKECMATQVKYQTSDMVVTNKADHSPVTIADQETSNKICATLARVTPNIPILCEETDDMPYSERAQCKLIWIVDPLDGTKEFIQGSTDYTVNIGLSYQGLPVFGIVGVPATRDIYWGSVGIGSFLNKTPINVTQKPKQTWKIVVSKSHLSEDTKTYIAENYPDHELLQIGSSLKLLYVAAGHAHIYPRFGTTSEWDTCASHAIVLGAGGHVLQRDSDKELEYNKESILNPHFICGI